MVYTVTTTNEKTKSNSFRLLIRNWANVQYAQSAKEKKKERKLSKTEIS